MGTPATIVNKHLCVSLDLGEEVTVESLHEQLSKLRNSGRGHYKIQIDDDQLGTPVALHCLQVADGDQIVELTHA